MRPGSDFRYEFGTGSPTNPILGAAGRFLARFVAEKLVFASRSHRCVKTTNFDNLNLLPFRDLSNASGKMRFRPKDVKLGPPFGPSAPVSELVGLVLTVCVRATSPEILKIRHAIQFPEFSSSAVEDSDFDMTVKFCADPSASGQHCRSTVGDKNSC